MPQLSETAPTIVNPIVDDPKDLEQLGVAEPEPELDPDPEPAKPDWQEPFSQLITSVQQLAQMVAQPRVEREVIREQAPASVEPKASTWREKLKPEQADLLEQALDEKIGAAFGQFREKEFGPTAQYTLSLLEGVLEDKLSRQYNDEDFGYNSLKDDVRAYRKAMGYQVDMETAYKRVAFDRMQETLFDVRKDQLKAAREGKRGVPVDSGGRGTKPEKEDALEADELQAAAVFFGTDEKTGKRRSQEEIEKMWVANRRGAVKDQLPD